MTDTTSDRTGWVEFTPRFDHATRVTHREWTLWLNNGQRRILKSHRALVEWAAEMGYTIVDAPADRQHPRRDAEEARVGEWSLPKRRVA